MARKKTTKLRRNIDLLRALKNSKPERRKKLLREADNDLVESVCDCARNVLDGNIPLTAARKRNLAKHKALLRKLADRQSKAEKKRKLFKSQRGGFLTTLIPALLGPVLSAVTELIAKK